MQTQKLKSLLNNLKMILTMVLNLAQILKSHLKICPNKMLRNLWSKHINSVHTQKQHVVILTFRQTLQRNKTCNRTTNSLQIILYTIKEQNNEFKLNSILLFLYTLILPQSLVFIFNPSLNLLFINKISFFKSISYFLKNFTLKQL